MSSRKSSGTLSLIRLSTIVLLLALVIPAGAATAMSQGGASTAPGKISPDNGAADQPVITLLKWGSPGGTRDYQYCIDTTDNDACDSEWVGTGTAHLARLELAANTRYFWQVRALEGEAAAHADAGSWWSFTTGGDGLQQKDRATGSGAGTREALNPSALPLSAVPSGTNILQDSSFEAYTPNPYWEEYSFQYGTPLCTIPDCGGGVGGRTGSVWAWFGGTIAPYNEVAEVWQTVTIPACTATLDFYLWIGYAEPGSGVDDAFYVYMDDDQIWTRNATHQSSFSSWTLVSLDVSAYADGAAHTVDLGAITYANLVNFNVDDVTLRMNCNISGNAGIPGASLAYTNNGPQTAIADGSGDYLFTVPSGWGGTVTPSLEGYHFTPTSNTYSNVQSHRTAQNYAAALNTYTISGNAGVAGATLKYDNGGPQTAIADGSGDYSFDVPSGWTGTVTPFKTEYSFAPMSMDYSNVTADYTGQDYSAVEREGMDFDRDSIADLGYFHEADGLWGILHSGDAFSYGAAQFVTWGQTGDIIVPGDYDGDGYLDPTIRRPPGGGQSAAYLMLLSSTGYDFGQTLTVPAGWPGLGDTPAPGDFNGDGITDPAIFRGNTGVWIIPLSPSFTTPMFAAWGTSGDKPVAADVDGDGTADIGYFRPSTGTWGFLQSSQDFSYASPVFFSWGTSTDTPVMKDYDGDGLADPAFVTPPASGQSAAYRILRSSTGYDFGQSWTVPAGWPGLKDTPVPADYDGDGKADAGIWRGNTGVWIIPKSSTNNAIYMYAAWGASGDQVVK